MKPSMNRIREWRERRGWTQSQLAERIASETDAVSTTQPTIQRLETGEAELTVRWMQRLAAVIGCSPVDLLSTAVIAELRDDVSPHESAAEASVAAAMDARGLISYRVTTDVVEQAGPARNDIIVIDTSDEALAAIKSGDVVLAFARAKSGQAHGLILRRFLAPDLLTTHRAEGRDVSFKLGDPEFDIEIRGVLDSTG